MLFHEIEYFLMVADCLSYSAAATKLYISQPGLSKVIAGMENELGTKLFRRSTRKVELTEAGKCFYALSRTYLDQCELLIRGELPEVLTGSLAVACENVVDATYMPLIIAAFRQRHPGIVVSTSTAKTEILLQELRSERADVGLLSSFAIPAAGFCSTLLYPYRLQILVCRGHPLASRKTVRLEELAGENFLVLNPSENRESETVLRLCAAVGFALKKSECVPNYRQMFMLTSQGEGIAFNLTLPQADTYWDLIGIPVELPEQPGRPGGVGVALAWSDGNTNPAIARFTKTVETLYASMRGRAG